MNDKSLKSQTVYKLRHKPTGLYYDPKGSSENASILGKVYNTKPSRQNWIAVHRDLIYYGLYEGEGGRFDTPLDEWEVVEFEIKEKGV